MKIVSAKVIVIFRAFPFDIVLSLPLQIRPSCSVPFLALSLSVIDYITLPSLSIPS